MTGSIGYFFKKISRVLLTWNKSDSIYFLLSIRPWVCLLEEQIIVHLSMKRYMPTYKHISGKNKCFVPYYWHSVWCKTSVAAVLWALFLTSQFSNTRWSYCSTIKFRHLESDPTGEGLSPMELTPTSDAGIGSFWLTDHKSGIPTVSLLALEWLVELGWNTQLATSVV